VTKEVKENKYEDVEVKFDTLMELLGENARLKEEVRELKSVKEKNPHQHWVHIAKTVDAWRIFPRAFITVYMFLLYYCTMWFMDLDEPELSQAGLISTVIGAGAAWFGLYTRSNGDGE
jgi:hypothetical protein